MIEPHIKVSCNSYKTNVFNGFSRLQQQQEFVDLTLAADGHLVKVHKNVIALASPYLKEMIQTSSAQDPVIFLNNVSYKILSYLLEYIYQGEVSVPENSIKSFIQVSKDLHIITINEEPIKDQPDQNTDNNFFEQHESHPETTIIPQTNEVIDIPPLEEIFMLPTNKMVQQQAPQSETTLIPQTDESFAALIKMKGDHNFKVQQNLISVNHPPNVIEINSANGDNSGMNHENLSGINLKTIDSSEKNLPSFESFNYVQNIETNDNNIMDIDQTLMQCQDKSTTNDYTINVQPSVQILGNEATSVEGLVQSIKQDKAALDALKIISQYSVSERGSVQIIVGRFIYSSHHNSKQGRKHRWRCIDYRKLGCPALIDSLDDTITLRKGIHNHTFHDRKICEKHKRKNIYHTYKRALSSRDSPKPKKVTEECDDLEDDIEYNVVTKT